MVCVTFCFYAQSTNHCLSIERAIADGLVAWRQLSAMMESSYPPKRKREADDYGDQPHRLPIRAAPSGVSVEATRIKEEELPMFDALSGVSAEMTSIKKED